MVFGERNLNLEQLATCYKITLWLAVIYKHEQVCSVQSYTHTYCDHKVYPGYNIIQSDSLLPQEHLVMFQRNTLQGQNDSVHELYHCNRKSVTSSSSPWLILNYGTSIELAAWGPRPGISSNRTINGQGPLMQPWYRVSQVVSLDFKYIFPETLLVLQNHEPGGWDKPSAVWRALRST